MTQSQLRQLPWLSGTLPGLQEQAPALQLAAPAQRTIVPSQQAAGKCCLMAEPHCQSMPDSASDLTLSIWFLRPEEHRAVS